MVINTLGESITHKKSLSIRKAFCVNYNYEEGTSPSCKGVI